MAESSGGQSLWMLFEVKSRICGIEADRVREVVPLGAVHRHPRSQPWVRGLCNVRGTLIPAISLRRVLDEPDCETETEELRAMLRQRKADHVNWVNALVESVREGRPFTLTRDPHGCAFGRWYDAYHPNDPVLAIKLLSIAQPHKKIHALADRVLKLAADGRKQEAEELIEHARATDLAMVTRLLDEIIDMVTVCGRQVVALVEHGAGIVGLVADAVTRVQGFSNDSVTRVERAESLLHGTAELSGGAAMLLDTPELVAAAGLT